MSSYKPNSFAVKELPDRYGIKMSAVYSRLRALDIRPEKQGVKAYVSDAQLERLDKLHVHIEQGGTLKSICCCCFGVTQNTKPVPPVWELKRLL